MNDTKIHSLEKEKVKYRNDITILELDGRGQIKRENKK